MKIKRMTTKANNKNIEVIERLINIKKELIQIKSNL
jgi:hypothetical protein